MGAEAPRFVLLEGAEGLEGPGAGSPNGTEATGPRGNRGIHALTGGGLAVLVDPDRGLLGVWQGEERMAGRLTLQSAEDPTDGALDVDPQAGGGADPTLRLGPGSWERTLPLPGGSALLERGLLPDVEGGVVLQWTLLRAPEPRAVTGSLGLPDGNPLSLPPLVLEPGAPQTVVLVPPGAEVEGIRKRLAPLRARELERERGRRPAPDSELSADEAGWSALGPGVRPPPLRTASLSRAVAILDDAPLGLDEEGFPLPPFLGGVDEGEPVLLRETGLAELGLGALLSGRHALARAVVGSLAADPNGAPPLHFLFLAARWASWTGRPRELLPLVGAMEEGVRELLRAVERGPAEGVPEAAPLGTAFPGEGRTLELLAHGLEPLGDPRWGDQLREELAGARAARNARGAPSGGAGPGATPGLALPVLGQAGSPEGVPYGEAPLVLPPPEAFGPPDGPGHGHVVTLRAARIVRSWVEGLLGAEADAAYGRLTLAPRIGTGTTELRIRGLRVGDASVSLDYRRQGPSCTFLLRQDRGRVPVNLIFAPRLPMAGVSEVRIGDEAGAVEVKHEPDGLVVRCQFPLDPGRRITIVGSD
jgi:hypothetical protein